MHKKRVKKVELDEKKHKKNSTKDHENTSQPMRASHPAADITYAANRWELKRAVKTLCERLVAIGEEYFLVTANISSGMVSHFGSVKGQDYIEEQSDIAWNFYRYCQDEESATEDPEIVAKGSNMDHSAINLTDPACLDMDQEFSELMDSDSSSDSKEDDINDGDEHSDISMLEKYSQTMETLSLGLGQSQGDTSDQSKFEIPPLKEELAKTQIMSDSKKSTNRRKRTGVKKRMYVDADYFDSDVDDNLNSDTTLDKDEKQLEIGLKERSQIILSDCSSNREQEDRAESGTSDLGNREKTRLSARKRRKQELVRRRWVDSKQKEEEEASDMTPPNG
ncbi:hypothetical protein CHS0354_030161 [Potamilus streckersoni]|uniref:Uncharacterized protein n=1 Tax=Potamilus streckersoni TaxID=2493646 RepID=A0AAE0W1F6_9BIVA|nr:hypothetical protein CHS0354_030161 [Potamilus streckersoni]